MANLPKNPVCGYAHRCVHAVSGVCTIGQQEACQNYELFTPKYQGSVLFGKPADQMTREAGNKLVAVVTNLLDNTKSFIGQIFVVDLIFTKGVPFNKPNLELVLDHPEYVEEGQFPAQLHKSNVIRYKFKAKSAGTVKFTANYVNEYGEKFTEEVSVTILEEVPVMPFEVKNVTVDKTNLAQEEIATLTVVLDGEVDDASAVEFTVDPDGNLTSEEEAVLDDTKMVITAKYKAVNEGDATIAIKTTEGYITKYVPFKVLAKPATITGASFAPTSAQTDDEVTLTINFDKAPELDGVHVSYESTKLEKLDGPTASDSNVTYKFKVKGVGETTVKCFYNQGESTDASITLTAAPAITSITAEPEAQNVNKDVKFTINFDKKPTLDDVKLTPDDAHMTEKTPKAAEGNNVTATYTLKGEPGKAKLVVKHRSQTEEKEITVNEAKAVLQSAACDPTSAAKGAVVTFTATFDKAPVLSEVSVTPESSKLTESEAPKISGNTVVAKYTVAASTGTAKVTFVHDGVTKDATVTVTGGGA